MSPSTKSMLPHVLLSRELADTYQLYTSLALKTKYPALLAELDAQMQYQDFSIKRRNDCARQRYLENTYAVFDAKQSPKEPTSHSVIMNVRSIVQNPQDYVNDPESLQQIDNYNTLLSTIEKLNSTYNTQLAEREDMLKNIAENTNRITHKIKESITQFMSLKKEFTPVQATLGYCDHITRTLIENGTCKAGGFLSLEACTACLQAASVHLAEYFIDAKNIAPKLQRLFIEINPYGMVHLKYQCALIKITGAIGANIQEYQILANHIYQAGKVLGHQTRLIEQRKGIIERPVTLAETKGFTPPSRHTRPKR